MAQPQNNRNTKTIRMIFIFTPLYLFIEFLEEILFAPLAHYW